MDKGERERGRVGDEGWLKKDGGGGGDSGRKEGRRWGWWREG